MEKVTSRQKSKNIFNIDKNLNIITTYLTTMTVLSQILDGVNMTFIAFHIPSLRCQKIPRWAFLLLVFIASEFLPGFDSLFWLLLFLYWDLLLFLYLFLRFYPRCDNILFSYQSPSWIFEQWTHVSSKIGLR